MGVRLAPESVFDMARCTHRFLAEPAGAVLLGNPGDATAIGAVEPVRYFFRASGVVAALRGIVVSELWARFKPR